eukprot:1914569-Alexandrium_andersonii.AAC.1
MEALELQMQVYLPPYPAQCQMAPSLPSPAHGLGQEVDEAFAGGVRVQQRAAEPRSPTPPAE